MPCGPHGRRTGRWVCASTAPTGTSAASAPRKPWPSGRHWPRAAATMPDISSGGNGFARIPNGPGYQVRFASRVKDGAAMPTMAVGLIREPAHAEAIIASGQADMVAIGRGFLNDPRWPWHAAEALGVKIEVPFPYSRAATRADIPSYAR
jgi:2,4-dienoyl-CoA reductase-like NADH-dependent reductase (Old Yellow Enzyme family)